MTTLNEAMDRIAKDLLALKTDERKAEDAQFMANLTDDQLRAECERRGIDTMTPEMTKAWAKDREVYIRRAEAAELRAENIAEELRGRRRLCLVAYDARETVRHRDNIDRPKPDTSHYVDPLDLLADDA